MYVATEDRARYFAFSMASTSNRRFKQEPDPEPKDSHNTGKVFDKGSKMTLTHKLMLSAELWGNEAGGDFEHLYTMPVSTGIMWCICVKKKIKLVRSANFCWNSNLSKSGISAEYPDHAQETRSKRKT